MRVSEFIETDCQDRQKSSLWGHNFIKAYLMTSVRSIAEPDGARYTT